MVFEDWIDKFQFVNFYIHIISVKNQPFNEIHSVTIFFVYHSVTPFYSPYARTPIEGKDHFLIWDFSVSRKICFGVRNKAG